MKLRGILLLFILGFWSIANASVDSDNAQIKDAIGVSLSNKGLSYFEDNLLNILESNGLETEYYYFEKIVHRITDEQIAEGGKTEEVLMILKNQFSQVFDGFVFNDQDIQLTLDGLFLQTKWDDVKVNFFDPNEIPSYSDREYLAGINLKFVASNIRFGVEKSASMVDLNNEWLGEIGANRFIINAAQQAPAFTFMLSIALYRGADGKIAARVEKPVTNFNQLSLDLDYEEGSLKFPDVSIRINDHEFSLNREKIESWFSDEEEKFLENFQNLVQGFIESNLDKILAKMITKNLGKGVEIYNEASVPGAKPEEVTPPLTWAMFFDRLEYQSNILSAVFNGSVFDFYEEGEDSGRRLYPAIERPYTATGKLSLENHDIQDSDLTLYFNVELFNQFIQVGFDRGYLKEFKLNEEEHIEINSPPYLRFEDGRVKMEIDLNSQVGDNLTERMVIKKKIRLKLDLFVELKIQEDGKVALILEEIDLESLKIQDESIRLLGKLFRKKIQRKVELQLVEANEDAKGRVLAEDIPIPSQLWGLPLKIKEISLDQAGYFLIETDFQLDEQERSL